MRQKTGLWQHHRDEELRRQKWSYWDLHPLWPQNKQLHTPWTTDWMHTRQDRWIQTELAKNATKPNPFEIISLQTTRKKNNWKTEETLARTVVTVETERIKGSSPWCLWWWWLTTANCTYHLSPKQIISKFNITHCLNFAIIYNTD